MSVLKDSSVIEDDVEFTEAQHDIWRTLYNRQLPKIEKYICKEYQEGFKNLQLPADHIPSIRELNEKITPRTGWKTVRTKVRYSDAVQWYKHFAAKEFLVTDYVRSHSKNLNLHLSLICSTMSSAICLSLLSSPMWKFRKCFTPAFRKIQD